ncbi:Radical SAM domain protein [Desulforamulus reducens MI-1]|uniref:Radical SAM domain protein n=1 Tax=Desulforamulus reducens (strain ATCC BAA-1160 / DSM 100696 / MI-1) TaxID=349161 RepID=A4J413_DESRM|nr:putative DNA modification/repair radical SAM protein [Desulforamulus reducens]ABO49816.1 Radical SAM domain protein [Desulforamulus reducens MI-1]
MELLEKLKILADAAKYDVSCSSSGSRRKNTKGGIGNAATSGICHSWSQDGRCISLLKILLTNYCVFNCAYCVNRVSNDLPRAAFTPDEVVDLTINFYRRNYIEGLFLSSAIWQNPNHTMELLLQTVKKLRVEQRFNGYIHLKAIPGADWRLIAEAGTLVDRMSVNIELPSSEGLKLLAPQKRKETIMKPMGLIGSQILECSEEQKRSRKAPSFVPAGQSTQLIIGATPDTDLKIIQLSENLYHHFNLKRVYYSAYVPVSNAPVLPQMASPPLKRENRLYQADWLLRYYGFKAQELLSNDNPNFHLDLDPKSDWALRNLHLFPVEVNKADYNVILRVPGIGVKSAKKIIIARKFHSLSFEDLQKIGVVLKRARYFITCKGRYYGAVPFKEEAIKNHLIPAHKKEPAYTQLSLFSEPAFGYQLADAQSSITGEI